MKTIKGKIFVHVFGSVILCPDFTFGIIFVTILLEARNEELLV